MAAETITAPVASKTKGKQLKSHALVWKKSSDRARGSRDTRHGGGTREQLNQKGKGPQRIETTYNY